MSPGRRLAFEILSAVERGGYASDLLAARATPLDTRDAGLASEIVLGVLRYRAQLDYLIERYSGKSAARLEPPRTAALCQLTTLLSLTERRNWASKPLW